MKKSIRIKTNATVSKDISKYTGRKLNIWYLAKKRKTFTMYCLRWVKRGLHHKTTVGLCRNNLQIWTYLWKEITLVVPFYSIAGGIFQWNIVRRWQKWSYIQLLWTVTWSKRKGSHVSVFFFFFFFTALPIWDRGTNKCLSNCLFHLLKWDSSLWWNHQRGQKHSIIVPPSVLPGVTQKDVLPLSLETFCKRTWKEIILFWFDRSKT